MSCKKCKQAAEGWAAMASHMLNSLDEETINLANSRKEICESCEKLKAGILGMTQCQECKCFFPMLVYSKTKTCPLGKW